jgi:hypothetical protein
MLNRAAIILKYKPPAIHWVNAADPSPESDPPSMEIANTERTWSLFREWFDVECHTVLIDTVGDAIYDDEERLVLATGRYVGEGFDDAWLDTLFLAMPISWKGTLIQYSGGLHRHHPGKEEVRIYDYVDDVLQRFD